MADADFDKVVLLLPMNGADGGKSFIDWSPVRKTNIQYADAHTETDQYKFYDSSGAFDGTGDYLLYKNADLALGSGDFTIECWLMAPSITSASQYFLSIGATAPTLFFSVSTSGFVVTTGGSTRVNAGTLNNSTWHHLAACRSGTTGRAFIDGVQVGSNWTENSNFTETQLYIGRRYDITSNYLNGYLQDLRITKAARYTENFAPPGALVAKTISGTVTDTAGDPAQRSVIAVPRVYPCATAWSTQSSAVDGTYSLTVPDVECSRIALADESTLFNDIIDRVLPG